MTPNPRRALAAATLTAGALAAAMLPATAATDYGAAPSYQEFRSSTYVDTDSQYVVNGDEPVATDGKLRQFYDQMVGDKHTGKPGRGRPHRQPRQRPGRQVERLPGRQPDLLRLHQVRQPTTRAWCTAMSSGAGQWEAASSKVNFVYVPARTRTATPATPACCSRWSR